MEERIYDMRDPQVAEEKAKASLLCEALNALPITEQEERRKIIDELFGKAGEDIRIMPGFHCDTGKNIQIGNHFLANYHVTILDRASVTIGDHVLIAPGVVIATSNHPLDMQGRRDQLGVAKPITIGNDVWIGANATVLPGVKVGNGVVVAAGAVVTKNIPEGTLVAGVPARVIRKLA